jgi:hypothetical protein
LSSTGDVPLVDGEELAALDHLRQPGGIDELDVDPEAVHVDLLGAAGPVRTTKRSTSDASVPRPARQAPLR